jgi:phage shock protein A
MALDIGGDPAELLAVVEASGVEVGVLGGEVEAKGASAIAAVIRTAWLRNPGISARAPDFPPREALAAFQDLVRAGDHAAAQRFRDRFAEPIAAAQAAQDAARGRADDRRRELGQEAHSLRQAHTAAAERARIAGIRAREAEAQVAAQSVRPPVPGSGGAVDFERLQVRAAELRAAAQAAASEVERLAAQLGQAEAAVAQHQAAAG